MAACLPPRTRRPGCRAGAALLAAACAAAGPAGGAPASRPAESTFPVRMVKTGGRLDDPAVRRHVEFCVAEGFNAVWVYGGQAGRWTARRAPDGPFLLPEFLELTRWCRERDVRVFVSVNPTGVTGGSFTFTDPEHVGRLRDFYRLLRRRAKVRDFVLSFDDQPTRLTELRDVVRYGTSTAPAHLDLAAALEPMFRRKETLWLCGTAYSDVQLGDGGGAYSRPFLEGLPALPERIGLIWTGPRVASPSITADDLRRARARLGGHRLLLYDNYPVNGNSDLAGLTLLLGPLRERGPRLYEHAAVYLSCPMTELDASRLPLLTVADYLRDPASYDPDASWERAMERLAGEDRDALEALRTQALEWGGWIGSRNYASRDEDNVYTAVDDLKDPAALARWRWVERRYPERMRALTGLADEVFRDQLLERMAGRLAVARAVPVVAALRAGDLDSREAAGRIDAVRRAASGHSQALVQLDLFLDAAGATLEPGHHGER